MNPRRLYRSRTDRAIAGIAGGMAEYLEVDPTIVRILWVLAGLFSGGLVILLYLILAFVIPLNPFQAGPVPGGAWGPAPAGATAGAPMGAAGTTAGTQAMYGAQGGYAQAPAWNADWNREWEARDAARAKRSGRGGLIIGTVLIVLGAVALADVVIPGWVSGALFWPAAILAVGAALLVASLRRPDASEAAAAPAAAAPAPAAWEAPVTPVTTTVFETAPATDAPAAPAGYASDETASVTLPEPDRS